ncbi:MAG: glycosyltransferase [Candidatus Helarchaeota archaeon]
MAKRDFFKKITRFTCSFAPKMKLIPPPSQWENGISVTMMVKNEKYWIKYSLASIKHFADEIIIADQGSTDGTKELIQEFMDNNSDEDIKFYNCEEWSFLELNNFLLKKARYRWILRFAGDMVAKTSGKYDIRKLRKQILNLNPNYYYGFILNIVFLSSDLFHTPKHLPFAREIYLHSNSQDIICFKDPNQGVPNLFIPLYYRIYEFSEPFIFHCDIKPRVRYLLRKYWGPWRASAEGKISLVDFVRQKIQRDYSTDSIKEAADKHLQHIFREIKPFNPQLYDGYPKIIMPLIKQPRFKIIYNKDGMMIDRTEPID